MAALLWSALASGFLTSIVPIGLAEAAAVALGATQPPKLALTLLAAFTLSHVAAKLVWYAIGAQAHRITPRWPRLKGYVENARALLAAHPAYGAGMLFSAALASIPPFHLAAIAGGIARVPLLRFTLLCIIGRALRFGIFGSVPAIVRALFA